MRSAFSVVISVAFLSLTLNSFTTFAGHLVGNGGFSIECSRPSSSTSESSLMALDVYDAKPREELFVVSSESSTMANVERLLHEMKQADDVLYRQIFDHWRSFNKEASFAEDGQLPQFEDYGRIERYPPNCKLLLTIFQRATPDEFGKRYLISRPLWDSLDSVNRAALIVHELIYRELIRRGQRDSSSTRRFVGYMLRGSLSELNKTEYEVLRRQTYLDEFQLMIDNLGGPIKIRFFDRILGDFHLATQTCKGIGSSSSLANTSTFKSISDKKDSQLERELARLRKIENALFWTASGYLYSVDSLELIDGRDPLRPGRILCVEFVK